MLKSHNRVGNQFIKIYFMQNLKIRNFFLSIVTIALLGVLITSCEREVITTVLEEPGYLTENISDEKLPLTPQEVLNQAEMSDNIESRTCRFDGCKYYIRSLTLDQVKASSKAPYKVYVYFYDGGGNYIGGSGQSFTPLSQTCSFVTYNLNRPANACRASAFVYSSSCGIAWTPIAC